MFWINSGVTPSPLEGEGWGGGATPQALESFAEQHLYNKLIQRLHIKSREEFTADKGMGIVIPEVNLHEDTTVTEINLNISDEELLEIGTKGIANADGTRRGTLGLSLLYLKAIKAHFAEQGRNPTDIELETLAQTWSEHCKHTIFASPIDEIKDGLYKHYIKRATNDIRKAKGKDDICISVFTDNAGGIIFDDEWAITDKVETHNSPSALDPFGGAITGIVGVNRDTVGYGMGAKPIINRYGFCFADPSSEPEIYRGKGKQNKALSPKQIMDGVIDGVNKGGNHSGIPTPQGFVYFDPRYSGKPLVFVGTVGLIPRKINGNPSHIKEAKKGDKIVMVGGRVGKDGIHGATFSSVALDEGSPSTAVQIGDPITQKKFSDAIVKEARDLELYNAITDNGAGGLSSSVGEMGEAGFVVDIDRVPLKYAGMSAWEIWISESQERMTLAIPDENIAAFTKLMNKRGVEATVIGEFTGDGRAVIRQNGEVIMDMATAFLHDGLPEKHLKTKARESEKQKVFFDTNIFSRILDHETNIEQIIENYEVYSSHIQEDELKNTKNEERRTKLLNTFKEINPIQLNPSFVFGKTKFPIRFSNGKLLFAIRKKLDAIKTKPNNLDDSLIAEIAIIDNLILVTDDGIGKKQGLYEVAKEVDCEVWSFKELLESFNPPPKSSSQILTPPQGGSDFLTIGGKLLNTVADLNICSKEFITTQYDHEVQATSVLKPLQGVGRVNSDATVTRPVLSSAKGVVTSQGITAKYSDIDTYHMAACAIDTAIRNAVAVGADINHLALLDNFCWCSSDEPERLYELKRACEACYDYAVAYGTPFISGKDSMFNDFNGFDKDDNPVKISAPPTLLVSALGVMNDATKAVSLEPKFAGDLVYVIGETFAEGGDIVPKVDAKKAIAIYTAINKAMNNRLIASAIAAGFGGIGAAVSKMAIGGQLGIEISSTESELSDEIFLFSESQSRFVVTVNPDNKDEFEAVMKDIYHKNIGAITDKQTLNINGVCDVSISDLETKYKGTLNG